MYIKDHDKQRNVNDVLIFPTSFRLGLLLQFNSSVPNDKYIRHCITPQCQMASTLNTFCGVKSKLFSMHKREARPNNFGAPEPSCIVNPAKTTKPRLLSLDYCVSCSAHYNWLQKAVKNTYIHILHRPRHHRPYNLRTFFSLKSRKCRLHSLSTTSSELNVTNPKPTYARESKITPVITNTHSRTCLHSIHTTHLSFSLLPCHTSAPLQLQHRKWQKVPSLLPLSYQQECHQQRLSLPLALKGWVEHLPSGHPD